MVPTTRSKTREEAKRCSLLELPAELRNRIYDYTLFKQDNLRIESHPKSALTSSFTFRGRPTISTPDDHKDYLDEVVESRKVLLGEPALLRVNRQVRNKTMTMHYSRTTFIASDEQVLHGWLHLLGPQRRDMIRRCVLDVDCWNYRIGLAWTTNLLSSLNSRLLSLDFDIPERVLKLGLLDRAPKRARGRSKRLDTVIGIRLLAGDDYEKHILLFAIRHQLAALSNEQLYLFLPIRAGFG
ncbi:hypothetical protein CLAFUW4_12108 [Fulvia fulva]|uniref:2EXR domain-containing protein n=1 Tax=Passalora fulva TaxID=5499 RepID=A0A9Q8USF9_PASFU|nr:uncharacterized protein CLAFUR5_11147 [Fulvia fulva]KAK4618083.1 hypothetical protein CLAFUR4_12113 [Fulvia fulva]KAK4618995.1 hypothetical protein CLAFUR0_12124 [Fulvia fulva]UJO20741.1 hypothetical protein CLAFUR5_11147 [Fulvia fulva]WPV18220.1 hypothetical protein CLAFUW4_12108 [Fulvia fulva]WPV32796.1 hypothetical protein CLAFUW7_12115 [Fulvia fulva]